MSHYPSGQELAAFRNATWQGLAPGAPTLNPLQHTFGAFDDELEWGIGYAFHGKLAELRQEVGCQSLDPFFCDGDCVIG